jgi:hypothetical protein
MIRNISAGAKKMEENSIINVIKAIENQVNHHLPLLN